MRASALTPSLAPSLQMAAALVCKDRMGAVLTGAVRSPVYSLSSAWRMAIFGKPLALDSRDGRFSIR